MIQRKQTLFLIAAFVLLVVAAFGITTIFVKTPERFPIATLSNFCLSDGKSANYLYSVMGIMLLGTAVLSVITIMAFRTRKLQMRLCWWQVFVILVYYVTRMSFVISIAKYLKLSPDFQFYDAFPLVALLFVILAYRGVRHDDKLVRDSYRIR